MVALRSADGPPFPFRFREKEGHNLAVRCPHYLINNNHIDSLTMPYLYMNTIEKSFFPSPLTFSYAKRAARLERASNIYMTNQC